MTYLCLAPGQCVAARLRQSRHIGPILRLLPRRDACPGLQKEAGHDHVVGDDCGIQLERELERDGDEVSTALWREHQLLESLAGSHNPGQKGRADLAGTRDCLRTVDTSSPGLRSQAARSPSPSGHSALTSCAAPYWLSQVHRGSEIHSKPHLLPGKSGLVEGIKSLYYWLGALGLIPPAAAAVSTSQMHKLQIRC